MKRLAKLYALGLCHALAGCGDASSDPTPTLEPRTFEPSNPASSLGNVTLTSEPQYGWPRALSAGSDGGLWYFDIERTSIARVSTDGSVSWFQLRYPSGEGSEAIAGPDGNIWFDGRTADLVPRLGRMTPDGDITLLEVPGGGRVNRLAAGHDGNVWFTKKWDSVVSSLTPDGAYTEYRAPSGELDDLASSPDGSIWFTDPGNNRIGCLSPDRTFTWLAIPTPDSGLQSIAVGPDGNVWFTETKANRIGLVEASSGELEEFEVAGDFPAFSDIAIGPDDALFYSQVSAPINRIGRITPAGVVSEIALAPILDTAAGYDLAISPAPIGFAFDAEQNLWATARFDPFYSSIVLRVTLAP